jgi:tetratricopeptide (TPR) repeat protein
VKPGRNDLCPCGSGRKYKECCGRLGYLATSAPPARGEIPAFAQNSHARADEVTPVQMSRLVALINAARYEDLESEARELLNLHPNAAVVWQLLGLALTRQGKDALQALEMAAQLLPDDAGVHNNLGNALGRLGQLDEAVASYRRALLLSPDFAEAHNNLGHAMLDLGQPDNGAAPCWSSVGSMMQRRAIAGRSR